MRSDNALNEHLDRRRVERQQALVYDALCDEMVMKAELERRRAYREQSGVKQ